MKFGANAISSLILSGNFKIPGSKNENFFCNSTLLIWSGSRKSNTLYKSINYILNPICFNDFKRDTPDFTFSSEENLFYSCSSFIY